MIAAQSTLRSIALDQPATIRVFERLHLDYCCGGNRPLAEACAQKGLDVETVVASLAEAASGNAPVVKDFSQAAPAELIRHIVQTHHGYVRNELPRLLAMAERVAAKHGPAHPEAGQIERQLSQLAEELLLHLQKEEIVLFPYIEKLEQRHNGSAKVPEACFGSVESPIRMMMHEHESAGALMEEMRAATGGFTPWDGACPTTVGLYDGLDAFERDLHRHVHLENNLLFPMAIALEQEVLAAK
ncbi:MAG: iron-sulfur cluster repair di-iron protein [Acidobacteriota bacterium]|nr:iron-sulfur cluster repair di-iron protein [Acidobacteriota bacterium]